MADGSNFVNVDTLVLTPEMRVALAPLSGLESQVQAMLEEHDDIQGKPVSVPNLNEIRAIAAYIDSTMGFKGGAQILSPEAVYNMREPALKLKRVKSTLNANGGKTVASKLADPSHKLTSLEQAKLNAAQASIDSGVSYKEALKSEEQAVVTNVQKFLFGIINNDHGHKIDTTETSCKKLANILDSLGDDTMKTLQSDPEILSQAIFDIQHINNMHGKPYGFSSKTKAIAAKIAEHTQKIELKAFVNQEYASNQVHYDALAQRVEGAQSGLKLDKAQLIELSDLLKSTDFETKIIDPNDQTQALVQLAHLTKKTMPVDLKQAKKIIGNYEGLQNISPIAGLTPAALANLSQSKPQKPAVVVPNDADVSVSNEDSKLLKTLKQRLNNATIMHPDRGTPDISDKALVQLLDVLKDVDRKKLTSLQQHKKNYHAALLEIAATVQGNPNVDTAKINTIITEFTPKPRRDGILVRTARTINNMMKNVASDAFTAATAGLIAVATLLNTEAIDKDDVASAIKSIDLDGSLSTVDTGTDVTQAGFGADILNIGVNFFTAASLAEVSTPTPEIGPVIYTVEKDDKLTEIARHYGVSVKALVITNSINNPDVIEIGQEIVIPRGDENIGKIRPQSRPTPGA